MENLAREKKKVIRENTIFISMSFVIGPLATNAKYVHSEYLPLWQAGPRVHFVWNSHNNNQVISDSKIRKKYS